MTELELRQKVVNIMRGWLGWSEKNGKFKAIIDLYNTQKPLPAGYKLKYSDEWCAGTVTAAGIKAGLSDIILGECSCSRMIELYKKKGRWMEADAYTPQPGDIIMYDWEDSGKGDNTGAPNHVGIVAEISGKNMTIIEGNKGEIVATRSMTVNGKFIRGYCLPDYASKATITEEDKDMFTYEQWVKYMEKYREEQGKLAESPWAKNEKVLEQVKAMGISDGSRPQDILTREEGMAMNLRTLEAIKKEG